MGYVIEISDSKVDKMSEYVEDMLWAGGELMHCLEKMKGESGYGEREGYSHEGRSYRKDMMGSRYGMRSRYDNYGQRGDYGYKDDDDWDEDEMMGERRGRRRRDSMGRYR
jgi:hypothetical protein